MANTDKITAQSFNELRTALKNELYRRSGNGSLYDQYLKLENETSEASINTRTSVEQ